MFRKTGDLSKSGGPLSFLKLPFLAEPKKGTWIFWQIWQTSLKMQARHRHKDTQSIFSDLPGAANSFGMRRKTKHNVEVPCGCHGCHINLWFARHANCQKQTPHKNSETLSTKCLEFWTPRWGFHMFAVSGEQQLQKVSVSPGSKTPYQRIANFWFLRFNIL